MKKTVVYLKGPPWLRRALLLTWACVMTPIAAFMGVYVIWFEALPDDWKEANDEG